MSRLLIPLLIAVLPAGAQFSAPRAAAAIAVDQRLMSTDLIRALERHFDGNMAATARSKEPLDVVGSPRGLYLPGYGVVLTAEVDLIVVPGAPALFNRPPTPEEKAQIHARKVEQLRVLEKIMRDTVTSLAQSLDIMPETDRVAMAVRLLYRPWEDTNNLPTQILMTADRKSAMAGQIKEETSK